jgi:hypothetical protein
MSTKEETLKAGPGKKLLREIRDVGTDFALRGLILAIILGLVIFGKEDADPN